MPIVTDGLVGYWNFRQGVSGNTWQNLAPSTKGKYNGTIVGPVLQATGMYFDGIDDYVEIDKIIELDKITSFTIEFRCRLLEYTWDSPVNTKNFGFWWGGSGIGTWLGDIESEINSTFYSATTHHITLIYDITRPTNDIVVWYVNGIPEYPGYSSSGVLESIFKDSSKLHLGDAEFTSIFGHMMFTRFYSRALTSQEIQQNYTIGDGVGLPTEPDPIIHSTNFQVKGTGKLNTSGQRVRKSGINVKGRGSLSTIPKKVLQTNLSITAKTTLNVSKQLIKNANLYLKGQSSLNTQAAKIVNVHTDFIGKGSLFVNAGNTNVIFSNVGFNANSVLFVKSKTITTSKLDILSKSIFNLNAKRLLNSNLNFHNESLLNINPLSIKTSHIHLKSSGVLTIRDGDPLIGVIELEGRRLLYVDLVARQSPYVDLQARKELIVQLRGDINVTMTNQNFGMYAGDTKILRFPVQGVEELEGSTITWEVKKGKNDAILTKNSKDGASIVDGRVHVRLDRADTVNLSGKFSHKCKMIDSLGHESTLFVGTMSVTQ